MAKKTAIKFGVPLMALALLLGLILGLGQVAQAQDSEPVQITDPVVLEGLLNGDLSVLNVDGVRAASETVMGYSVRHHWGYPGNLQVYVNNTSNTEFTDFLIQARLKNGQLDDRQLSANMTPKDAYFPRISQETDPVALGVRMSDGGRTDSLHDATICNNGPMVVINRQTNGVSYPVIQNIFVGQTIYYRLVGGANWRQLQNNAYEGWAVQQKQGSIEIKLQATDEAPMCLLVSWDWDYQEQSPLTLIISDTSTVVGTDLMVPVAIRNNTGQVFSIDARLQYSPTHLSFLGIDQVGTLSSGFQYILNTQTPGQIIITGQGTQPITAES
ncbi:MAG: hypothetical protein GW762_04980, partial [Candidatus Pacebacteria bacterium]|nr:hypothetical protein [Candidatus Paceibacterota bacterium]